ncbi:MULTISPECIES: phospho-sugar mutase [Erysipelothrix]|uniref:phospho-sugar mutase n=1 Tax=Erysipelothrix TaxID=1647 RepID=UPI00190D45B0|nr:phospho-sugar mutase [Erysipelothrix sp. strain 2 (EsS2-6-Brazil)]MBK2402097.1 phospho-sugar mutase [Erysipelothrix sp. strain 2 (EsS2-6-Brazil)]
MSLDRWNELARNYSWIEEAMKSMDESTKQDAFYKSLEFGTAGMRGLLGIGPNRMNVYTVAKASVGFAKYLVETFKNQELKIAIAYDNRHMSKEFADVSAMVLSTYGIKSYIFSQPRPTPELSFAVRTLNCVGGIVITASHNPKEYNGYKVYDENGCQLVDHKIARVITLINEEPDETCVDINQGDRSMITYMEADFDETYKDAIHSIQLRPEEEKTLSVVFTSQHGTSYPLVPDILTDAGYHVIPVLEQSNYDPNFSDTKTPNPEEKASYDLAVEYAKNHDADLVLSCDPDADRMGIVVKHQDTYVYLTGNQGGSILQEYIYATHIEKETMPENPIMFNTVVTSDLGEKIAQAYGVNVEKTLTGFKYIGDSIENHNKVGDYNFVFGYEESYGYLIADFVRDKDALQACMMVAEAANYYKNKGLTLVDVLNGLYDRHGAYHETQVAITLSGQEGLNRIQEILTTFRESNIEMFAGIKVLYRDDYLTSTRSNGEMLTLPKSNVIKYSLEDGSWIAIRPSGTEPKCKFYYCVVGKTIEESLLKFEALKKDINQIAQLD